MVDGNNLTSAFIEWSKTDTALSYTICATIAPIGPGIGFTLRPFAPYLTAFLSESGVSVAVEWNDETWDLLFDNDLVAVQVPSGRWRCDLCHDLETESALIEDLWIDHLFAPLADWIERVLMPARALFLCERRGARWAVLTDGTVIPAHARFAAFEHSDSSDDR